MEFEAREGKYAGFELQIWSFRLSGEKPRFGLFRQPHATARLQKSKSPNLEK